MKSGMYNVDVMIAAADLETLLIEIGLEPQRRRNKNGFELYFHCFNPEHPDNQRRMSMAEKGKFKGLFYCWKCKFRGNIVSILEHFLNMQFHEVLAWMHIKTGVGELLGTQSLIYRVKKEKLNYGVTEEEKVLPTFDVGQYRSNDTQEGFRQHVFNYLGGRGITEKTCRKYQVDVGIHPQIGACITIPVIFKGKCHSIYFGQAKDGGEKRYPEGAPQGDILFNYDECVKHDHYVLVESILDVLMLDSMNLGPAMACFTNMVSDAQISLLIPFSKHAVFPDRDSKYGWDLVTRLVKGLDKSIKLIMPPLGKDPGDCEPWEIVDSYAQSSSYAEWEVDGFMRRTLTPVAKIIRLHKK